MPTESDDLSNSNKFSVQHGKIHKSAQLTRLSTVSWDTNMADNRTTNRAHQTQQQETESSTSGINKSVKIYKNKNGCFIVDSEWHQWQIDTKNDLFHINVYNLVDRKPKRVVACFYRLLLLSSSFSCYYYDYY